MKYFLPPVISRPRDRRVLSLVRRGEATDDELFGAQFGEWPVAGLEKDTDCADTVSFHGYCRDPKLNPLSYIFSYAYVRPQDEKSRIFLNGLLLSPLAPVLGFFAGRQSYARVHDVVEGVAGFNLAVAAPELLLVTLLSSYRYAMLSSLVKMVAPSLSDIVGEEHFHIMQARPALSGIARAAFQASVNDWAQNQTGLKRLRIELGQFIDMVLTMMPRGYFASDPEVQARLHNIMVEGYPAWGKIPQDRPELYAALADMGVKKPGRVGRWLGKPEQGDLRAVFQRHASFWSAHLNPSVAEVNIGLNSYRHGDILEAYWKDCLPFLYGDILVRYGDSAGLEKMGFSAETDLMGLPVPLAMPPEARPPGL